MNKKFLLAIILVIFMTCFITSCGNNPSQNKHSHNYEYGFCKGCGTVSEERKADLSGIVKTVCQIYCWGNYEMSSNQTIEVEFLSISPDISNLTCNITGTASFKYGEYTFKDDFNINCKWSEKDDRFIHDNGTFDGFYAFEDSGNMITTYFPNDITLTHNEFNGNARSVLDFDSRGNLTQTIYNYRGYVADITNATYFAKITPNSWVITVTAGNGNKVTMYYFPKLNGLMWGNDAYTP